MTSVPPLQGRRVLVTRGVDKRDDMAPLLEAAGAFVLRVPLIEVRRLLVAADIARAVDRAEAGAGAGSPRPWLVLTSATGAGLAVEAVGAPSLARFAIAVIGPATAAALRSRGVDADLEAAGQVAESLAAELVHRGIAGAAVLVVTAAGARDVIAPALIAAGAHVEVLEAYRSVTPEGAADRLREALSGPPLDAVTFTSGSTVRHFAAVVDAPPPGCLAACIGPVTAAVARAAGWTDVVTAAEHTTAGMVAALLTHLPTVHRLP
jgi:uroporphyrinogen-III synthase